FDRPLPIAGGEELPVRAEGERVDGVNAWLLMPGQLAPHLPGLQVPQAHTLVDAAGGEQLAVGADRQRIKRTGRLRLSLVLVLAEDGDQLGWGFPTIFRGHFFSTAPSPTMECLERSPVPAPALCRRPRACRISAPRQRAGSGGNPFFGGT